MNEDLELKKEFQLERIILFSDAVFAIIVTIMVIELKLPEGIREASIEEFKHAYKHIYIQLFGYALSFFFVAMFWTRHVKLFGFLKDYNTPVLVFNLLFLFCISLFPFAVSVMTNFKNTDTIQGIWGLNTYIAVICLCLMSFTILTGYLIKNSAKLCFSGDKMQDELKWKAFRINYFLIPVLFVAVVVFNSLRISPQFSIYLIAIYGAVFGRLTKHYYPKSSGNGPVLKRLLRKRQKKSPQQEPQG